ncbi:MAG: hypothetical protein ACR2HH_06235 [Chthoniobacterales bacterium]
MSAPDSNSPSNKPPLNPERIRLAPSRNQKQRSRLKQAADEPGIEAAPPPPPPKIAPESPRRARLKRSGQMHEDLTAPMPPPATPPDEAEY